MVFPQCHCPEDDTKIRNMRWHRPRLATRLGDGSRYSTPWLWFRCYRTAPGATPERGKRAPHEAAALLDHALMSAYVTYCLPDRNTMTLCPSNDQKRAMRKIKGTSYAQRTARGSERATVTLGQNIWNWECLRELNHRHVYSARAKPNYLCSPAWGWINSRGRNRSNAW